MSDKKHKQHILAVTAESVIKNIQSDGFTRFLDVDADLPFETNDVIIGPRDILESSEAYMQIIPYIMVMRDGKILSYSRTKSGGETRLHDKVSIGFGGHIDVGDITVDKATKEFINVDSTVANAAQREIGEELNMIGKSDMFAAVGLIVDTSNPVGRVHVGVAIIVNTDGMVSSKEDQIDLKGFRTKEEILAEENLEGWSRIMLEGGLFT